MKIFLVILTVLVAVEARAQSSCKVSSWSPWEERAPSYHDHTVKSYPEVWTEKDVSRGQQARSRSMAAKTAIAEKRRQCLQDGSCPELVKRNDEGAFPCIEGFINGNLPCSNINQRAFIPMEALGANEFDQGNDIWGWTDPEDGHEYAIMGTESGTSFIRVTNPENPEVLGFLPTQTSSSTWRDMKVVNDHAYIVSEASGHGIQVFDLTRLRGQSGFSPLTVDAHYDELSNCHNIVGFPERNLVFAVGCTTGSDLTCSGGLHAVDVSDPKNPSFAGCFADDGYVHDAQCVNYVGPDSDHQGEGICFCYNENTLTIVEATNPAFMRLISRTGYGASYTHQGWVTEDHTILLLDDELDEQSGNGIQKTYIWDITDLDNPTLENTFNSGLNSIDHNQYIIGDLTYQANYMSGLRVLYINSFDKLLSEVAYFDVFPSRNDDDFYGAWSIYPYFPSGNMVISSIDYGLYVITPDMAAIRADIARRTAPRTERIRYREILQGGGLDECPPLVEIQTDYRLYDGQ